MTDPTAYRPRRGGVDHPGDFSSECDARAEVEALREKFPTVAEAEASQEWRVLHRRLSRWILRTARGLPVVSPEEHAQKVALVYLRAPHFLPMLPPAGVDEPDAGPVSENLH